MTLKKFLKLKSFYVSLVCSALFIVSFSTTTYAWFTTKRTAEVNFSSVTVRGGDIQTFDWKIIKNDGSYTGPNGDKTPMEPIHLPST